MRIFKTRWFTKWAGKEGLTDKVLSAAIAEMETGLIDADLGGNIYKKRVARPGQGKSGSTRIIVAFKIGEKAFFMYGFAKNKMDNINDKELEVFKIVGGDLLSYNGKQLETALEKGELMEVINE